jgi:hypothetical protein
VRERVSGTAKTTTKSVAAAVLWTVAVALGVGGTVDHNQELRFWALMAGMVAVLVSGHLVVCHAVRSERVELERLIEGLIAGARERADRDRAEQDVSRIR